jgi:hypothetical protein
MRCPQPALLQRCHGSRTWSRGHSHWTLASGQHQDGGQRFSSHTSFMGSLAWVGGTPCRPLQLSCPLPADKLRKRESAHTPSNRRAQQVSSSRASALHGCGGVPTRVVTSVRPTRNAHGTGSVTASLHRSPAGQVDVCVCVTRPPSAKWASRSQVGLASGTVGATFVEPTWRSVVSGSVERAPAPARPLGACAAPGWGAPPPAYTPRHRAPAGDFEKTSLYVSDSFKKKPSLAPALAAQRILSRPLAPGSPVLPPIRRVEKRLPIQTFPSAPLRPASPQCRRARPPTRAAAPAATTASTTPTWTTS